MDTVVELAKAKGMPDSLIKRIVDGANKSAVIAHKRRRDHKWARGGWSMDKGKTRLSESIMTPALYLLFMERYFPDNADDYEKAKLAEQFRKDYPQFASRF